MNSMSGFGDDGVETGMMISGVMNSASGTIGLEEAVVPYDFVSNSLFCLFLNIMGMGVMDSIFEFVMRSSLEITI